MNISLLVRPLLLLPAVSFAAVFSGCAGPSTKSSVGVSVADYDQVYVLGSHIPVLVPKGSGARPIHPISPAVIILQDDIQRAMGAGPVSMH